MMNTFAMKNLKLYSLLLAGAALISCEPELDNDILEDDVYTAGEADFSNYVAVGNSLTAGFADSALYIQGQENSYPNIMAQQFQLAGGGEFVQPLVDDNVGGLLAAGVQIQQPRFVLAVDANGNPTAPTIFNGTPTTDITNVLSGPFNNMGVPGAKSFHLGAPGYGNIAGVALGQANPYFVRFASEPNATIIGDAVAQDPSFFSLWIGNNDILSYATSGGSGVDQTGNLDPTTYGSNDITDPNVFASVYSGYVSALTANGAGGALVNIPDVTSIPFFTTVPVASIPLDAQTAAFLQQQVTPYNQGLQFAASQGFITPAEAALRTITFQPNAANAPIIEDPDLTDGTGLGLPSIRQANDDDLITFTAASVLGTLANPGDANSIIGVGVPLGAQFVLSRVEQDRITAAQTAYNATIQGLAAQNGLAYVDARAALAQVANSGVSISGGQLTSTYASGGAFSLDGVHPTPRGYAYTANVILDAINDTYGSNIPGVDVGSYSTVNVSNGVGN